MTGQGPVGRLPAAGAAELRHDDAQPARQPAPGRRRMALPALEHLCVRTRLAQIIKQLETEREVVTCDHLACCQRCTTTQFQGGFARARFRAAALLLEPACGKVWLCDP